MRHRGARPPLRHSRGVALILFVSLLAMGVLYFVVSQLETFSAYQRVGGVRPGGDALAQARDALLGYASTYRDSHSNEVYGYLPCPDTDGDGNAEGSCGNAGESVLGLLPYKTLGLPDLRDTSGNCLWYAVSGSHKNNPKGNAASLWLALNWDTQGMLGIATLAGSALTAPENTEGGAAAVIIAPGAALAGQSRSPASTTCGVNPAGSASEYRAFLDANYAFPSTSTITLTQGTPDSTSNNDALAWVSPRDIFNQVVRREAFKNNASSSPAGQINTLATEVKAILEQKMQTDLLAGTAPTSSQPYRQSGYQQYSGKLIGELSHDPANAVAMTPLGKSAYDAYLDNWYEQFRYAECSTLGGAASSACLSIAGTACRGALLFGGRYDSGQVRQTTQRPNSATPDLGRTAFLSNYFEASGALGLLNSSSVSFSGNTTYSDAGTDASRSADVATCLFPGSFVSFAQDLSSFASHITSSSPTDPQIVASTANGTVTLYALTDTARSGCIWYGNKVDFSSMMRVYFRFQITDKGQGFTFTIADAATNDPTATNPPMCGASGTRLGYASAPPGYSTAGIKPPKMGMEVDLVSTTTSTSRNDPSSEHFAFLYWGGSSDNTVSPFSGTDDINHGFGTTNSATEPRNPRVLTTSSVSAMSWSGGTVTVTTSANHELWTGQSVTLSGASPSAYNGTYSITVLSSTQFSFSLSTNPGVWTSGGSISTPRGIATVQSSDPYLPYSSLPLNTYAQLPDTTTSPHDGVIHVRLDISKSYDGSSTGTYTLKAYIGDRFTVYDSTLGTYSTCTVTDFENLSKNLEDLCTQTAKIVQSNVRIQNISGEAFAKAYVGFTTSRSSLSSDDQNITISNFMMRAQ